MIDLSALPRARFIDTDPAALAAAMVESFGSISGRSLLPAQPERLFLDWLAYQFALQRMAVQDAGEQTLLAYARGQNLDHLGALLGVERLPARAARAVFEVRMAAPADTDRTVGPLAVWAPDRARAFVGTVTVPAGAVTAEAVLVADVAGAAGNGYLPGQITVPDAPVAGVAAVSNVGVSHGGADIEDDERLRRRIQEAPESFSVAGPDGAYRWHALSAHASVLDVAVTSPRPGAVTVHVLTDTGLPSDAVLALVRAALSAASTRPLSDTVTAAPPVAVPYALDATVWLRADADAPTVRARVEAAAAAWTAERARGLGRDLIPSQAVVALSVPGVHRVELAAPAFRPLAPREWATCTGIALAFRAETAHG
ncbi:baseplate assembly protein [Azospirillum halopraeferens]|uniref:baseplate assembly protein n=1 Tax=Azospirillum halopraeferens TaxID=34010 RepID=UPI00040A1AA3|nr:baseplate J/gp47 family protein [Azospirillum halopraeferens]